MKKILPVLAVVVFLSLVPFVFAVDDDDDFDAFSNPFGTLEMVVDRLRNQSTSGAVSHTTNRAAPPASNGPGHSFDDPFGVYFLRNSGGSSTQTFETDWDEINARYPADQSIVAASRAGQGHGGPAGRVDSNSVELMSQTADGENSDRKRLEVGHTDLAFWRPITFWTEEEKAMYTIEPYKQTYEVSDEAKPSIDRQDKRRGWSYAWWPKQTCRMAFGVKPAWDENGERQRSPGGSWEAVSPSTITSDADRKRKVYLLSPLECYDTYIYNKYGENPCSAAWEAQSVFHNQAPNIARRSDFTKEEFKQYWIVRRSAKKLPGSPFESMDPPSWPTDNYGRWQNYDVTMNGKTFKVRARIGTGILGLYSEIFYVPYKMISGMEEYAVKLGEFGNDSNRIRAEDPRYLCFYRIIGTKEINGVQCFDRYATNGWYTHELTLVEGGAETSWFGHCNGFAAASLMVDCPPSFPVVKKFDVGSEKGIVLLRLKCKSANDAWGNHCPLSESAYEYIQTTSKELKIQAPHYFGVASEAWMMCNKNIRNSRDGYYTQRSWRDYLGTPYQKVAGDKEKTKTYLEDIYPQYFFILLMDFIKEQGHGIVIDKSIGLSKYNCPISGFRYRHEYVERSEGDSATKRFYKFDFWIDRIQYGGYGGTSFIKPTQKLHYTANIYLDDFGRVCEGEWTGDSKNDHPDFVWIPVSNADSNSSTAQNRRLKSEKAAEFLDLEEGEISMTPHNRGGGGMPVENPFQW